MVSTPPPAAPSGFDSDAKLLLMELLLRMGVAHVMSDDDDDDDGWE